MLLSPTSVDVLPIHSILHEGNVVIRGQCEVGDAAHKASHVLSVRVQSDFLHSTCKEAKGVVVVVGRMNREEVSAVGDSLWSA